MSVRQSLLAILDQGPCYGYQLRTEFDRRTGSSWPVNVGQIYTTLDRLERDGLVAQGDTDEHGHVYYEITDAGRTAVREWLRSPVTRVRGTRDELPLKLALAATLPGVDVAAIVEAQRRSSLAGLAMLRDARRADDARTTRGEELARQLVIDAQVFQAEAEVLWLDHLEDRLAQHPPAETALPLVADRPRRGRPPRTVAPTAVSSVLAGRTPIA
ncbi:PadR family transcriptional regulator [Microbacterium sp.]|jgi:DNA-binding PadR family transcriptional regulator|uniref:PadR family transcriptional regulator n=1 Tax=Microbacterium sp. TaxID=51671 RepID=UPI0037C838B0